MTGLASEAAAVRSGLKSCPFPSCSGEGSKIYDELPDVSQCPACRNLIIRCSSCSTFNRTVAGHCRSCGSRLATDYKSKILAEAQSRIEIPLGQYFDQGEPRVLEKTPRHVAGQSLPSYALVPAGGMLLMLGGEGGMRLLAEPFARSLDTRMLDLPLAKTTFPWGGYAYGRYVFLPTEDGLHRLETRGLVPELYQRLRREQRLNELVTPSLGPTVLSRPAIRGRRFAYISNRSPVTVAVVDLHDGSSGIAKLGSAIETDGDVYLAWLDNDRLLLIAGHQVLFIRVDFPADAPPRPRLRKQVDLPAEVGSLRSPAVAGQQLYGIDKQSRLCMIPLSVTAMHTAYLIPDAEGVQTVWPVRLNGSSDELICAAMGKTLWVSPGPVRQDVRSFDVAVIENIPPSLVGGSFIAVVGRLSQTGHRGRQNLHLVRLVGNAEVVRSEEHAHAAFLGPPVSYMERLFAVVLKDSRPHFVHYDLTPEEAA